jgi:hypothetical protein
MTNKKREENQEMKKRKMWSEFGRVLRDRKRELCLQGLTITALQVNQFTDGIT